MMVLSKKSLITLLFVIGLFFLSVLVSGVMAVDNQDPNSCRNNPVAPPPGYRWEADCGQSCKVNTDCPANSTQTNLVNSETSNWCYGFKNWTENRCLQLKFVGAMGGTHSDSCTQIEGWACDVDDFNSPLKVEFFDGRSKDAGQPEAGERKLGEAIANLPRDPGVARACGGNSNHGFNWTVPDALKDGKPHDIYAYAYHKAGDAPKLWNFNNNTNDPVTIQCTGSGTTTPIPTTTRGGRTTGSCQNSGDLNGDGKVDEDDFEDWVDAFLGVGNKLICGKSGASLVEFNIWRFFSLEQ